MKKAKKEPVITYCFLGDNDGHDYMVPSHLRKQFWDLLEGGEETEEEFINIFDKYRLGSSPAFIDFIPVKNK